jgi:glycosyltransferase involved in cell wall biosynthesis
LNFTLRIMILTPTVLPEVTGNAITAQRWRRGLEEKGLTVHVLATRDLPASHLEKEIDRFHPDIIHAHHASQSGGRVLDLACMNSGSGIPFVVSPAGTDINQYLEEGPRKEDIFRVLHAARAIVAQGPATLQRLMEILPECAGRIFPVPKSIFWFGEDDCRLRDLSGCRPGDVLFFLPAGVRPVKGNLECLMALEKVRAARPRVRVVFAGPALDVTYAAQFAEEIRQCSSFARWIPLIPPAAMQSAYAAADVVVNASFSEGLANALLEAMAAGRPLLASDIPGNRGPIVGEKGDCPSGILFNPQDPQDFVRQALRLIDDEALRDCLGQAGKQRAATCARPGEEAAGLIRAYAFARQSK